MSAIPHSVHVIPKVSGYEYEYIDCNSFEEADAKAYDLYTAADGYVSVVVTVTGSATPVRTYE